MDEALLVQFTLFGYSCFLGIGLGVLYDVFRIIRIMINPKNIGMFVQDVIYFLIAGVITFVFVLNFNHGESRAYIVAGEGIGWIAYHLTLGEFIYKMSQKVLERLKSKILGLFLKKTKKK